MPRPSARLFAVAAALLFSTGGAGIKVASFTGPQVAALRSGIAAVALLIWLGRRVRWSPQVAALGVVYACMITLFVNATKLTTAANAIFLQSAAPLYLLLLEPLLLHERFRPRDLVFTLAAGAGMALCIVGRAEATATAPDPARGNFLGVLSGVTWALTLLSLRWLERDETEQSLGVSAVVVGNLMASLASLPFAWPLPAASGVEWATVAYLGIVQIGLGYVCLAKAMRGLPALEASLILLIEPALNPLWTWLFRGEQPGVWVLAGGAIILAATAGKALQEAASGRE